MLGIAEKRLRSWERQGWIPPLDRYTIADLVVLRTLATLRKSGVSASRIGQALTALRERLGELSDPLRELRIVSSGKKIVVQVGDSRMEPVSGQLLLDFDSREIHRLVSFPVKRQSGSHPVPGARRAESAAWFEKAVDLERAGAPVAEIIRAYERSAEADPGSAGALVNLGTIYFHMRSWDTAEKYYRQAVEADPSYPLAHFNLANLFDEKGDRGQALVHYLWALRLDPEFADAHYNAALLYQNAGQVMRAMRHWKIYLKLDPSGSWAASARRELEALRRATLIPGARRNQPPTA